MNRSNEPARHRRGLIVILLLAVALVGAAGVLFAGFEPHSNPPPMATQRPLDLARAAYLEHDFKAAEKLLRELLRVQPEDREARLLLGRVLNERGRLKEALELFESLLKLNPKDIDALRGIAKTLRAMGQPASAVRSLQAAAELRKDDPGLWKELGLAQRDAGDTLSAFTSIQKSLSLDPDQADLSVLLSDLAAAPVTPGLPGQTGRNPQDRTSPQLPNAGIQGPNRPRPPGFDPLLQSGPGNPR